MAAVTGGKPKIEILSDEAELARRMLDLFIEKASACVKARGVFRVAISGGQTPRRFFEVLGEGGVKAAIPWDRTQVFWVDERCVPHDSPLSNYRLAAETFLAKVPLPRENIHPVPTDCQDLSASVESYERTIRKVFGLSAGQWPRFDLVVLGMGADGHTGSLFPGSYAQMDQSDLACVVYTMDDKPCRITLTGPVLKAASKLVVLVSGSAKAAVLKDVLTLDRDEVKYPIHLLWDVAENVTFLADDAAVSLLERD